MLYQLLPFSNVNCDTVGTGKDTEKVVVAYLSAESTCGLEELRRQEMTPPRLETGACQVNIRRVPI